MNGKYLISKHATPNSNKFRIKVDKKCKIKKKLSGKTSNFLINITSFPECLPDPPKNFVLYLVKKILINYKNSLLINEVFSLEFDPNFSQVSKQKISIASDSFLCSNAWLVFRSYYTNKIPQEISTQTDLSSVLSSCWTNDSSCREIWHFYNQCYKNFRESSPKVKITFKEWINSKYNLPNDFLIVYKHTCDKIISIFQSDLQFPLSENGNYIIFNTKNRSTDIITLTSYLLDKLLENKNAANALTSAIQAIDDQLNKSV
ncbi:hypothetical protein QEN19_002891 [Hanseniaspora menglaensis]